MPKAKKPKFYTPEEIEQAIKTLSKADLTRLNQIAQVRARGNLKQDAEDLLMEALTRILAGGRKWPRNVALVPFFSEVMRSIASDWRRQLGQQRESSSYANEKVGIVPEKAVPPDEILSRQQAYESVRNELKSNPIDLDLLDKKLIGLRGKERKGKLDKTIYDTALTRIRRAFERLLP